MTFCLLFILAAALCASSSNLCLRKNLEAGGKSEACLVVYFGISFVFSLMINPVLKQEMPFSPIMLSLGLGVGVLIGIMMWMTSQALRTGPSATTFAFQNSGCVFPTLILALIFGEEYGFSMTLGGILGALCVIAGLFWAARQQNASKVTEKKWYFFAISMFLMQSLILTLFQWRCLLTRPLLPKSVLIPFSCQMLEEIWFMPGLFAAATLIQVIVFMSTQRRLLNRKEIFWGFLGGLGNGGSTYLLLNAVDVASVVERSIAFPLFAVTVIVICNMWGQRLYREPVAWSASALCVAGILIAAII